MTNFINVIGEFILSVLVGFVNMILLPIDVALQPIIPNYNNLNTYINNLFNHLHSTIVWALEWFHFPSFVISIMIAYIGFKLVFIPLAVGAKVALKMYDKLH